MPGIRRLLFLKMEQAFFNRTNRIDSKRRSETCRGPRLKQTARKYQPPANPFQRGLQQ